MRSVLYLMSVVKNVIVVIQVKIDDVNENEEENERGVLILNQPSFFADQNFCLIEVCIHKFCLLIRCSICDLKNERGLHLTLKNKLHI